MNPEATENEQVLVGRISTVTLMVLAALVSFQLQNAKEAFDIIIMIGAGTGLIFILRWFWWRINAYSEISAMIISFLVALFFYYDNFNLPGYVELLLSVLITTLGWLLVTFLTPPANHATLTKFYKLTKPASLGWKPVIAKAVSQNEINNDQIETGQLPLEILCMFLGCITVYCALFATGFWIYGNSTPAMICSVVAIIGTLFLVNLWKRLKAVKLG